MRVNAPAYPQLDDQALALLKTRLHQNGNNRAALARDLGMSRSAISQALDGKYPGDTRKLRAVIVETLADQIDCPHLGVELSPGACKAWRERPLSAASGSRSDAKHWQACQVCQHNPARRRVLTGEPA